MFLLGIGGHLKVSHMDPRVSFGNESTNLSVQRSFSPFYFKSSHPNRGAWLQKTMSMGGDKKYRTILYHIFKRKIVVIVGDR